MCKQLSKLKQFAVPLDPAHRAFVIETLFTTQRILLRLIRANAPRQLRKLCRHRGVAPCELLDRQIIGLVVGQAQIVGGLVQRFLGFFQVLDRIVNAFDGLFKAFGGQAPIAPKRRLEFVEVGFKLRDVHVLRAHQRQLGLVLHRVQRRQPPAWLAAPEFQASFLAAASCSAWASLASAN